jgi:hypothetical protein
MGDSPVHGKKKCTAWLVTWPGHRQNDLWLDLLLGVNDLWLYLDSDQMTCAWLDLDLQNKTC